VWWDGAPPESGGVAVAAMGDVVVTAMFARRTAKVARWAAYGHMF